MRNGILFVGGVLAVCVGLAVMDIYRGSPAPNKKPSVKPIAISLPGDPFYATNRPVAKEKYAAFIKGNEASPDKKVQDQVGQARIKLAYIETKDHDFEGARRTFKEAERKYKGEGQMNSDFGGIKDAAAYQAIVCLIAEHKDEQAKTELREFMKTYLLSPLVHAAHTRLVRLIGKATDEDDVLLQNAVSAQEKRIREETAMCGPKCIVKLLQLSGNPPVDYKAVAKLCGTTEKGTSLEGMKKGLKALGIQALGLSVNRRDFARLPLPAILLSSEHYVVITSISPRAAITFDPTLNRVDKFDLPGVDNPDFTSTVLVTSLPDFAVAPPERAGRAPSSPKTPIHPSSR